MTDTAAASRPPSSSIGSATAITDGSTGATATPLPAWALSLNLQPHPEGGYFRETWRSDVNIPVASLPTGFPAARSAGTAILFLLMPGQQSAWHTVRGAEIWFHHRGSPIALEVGSSGSSTPQDVKTLMLGPDVAAGQLPQLLVSPGEWQRARPVGNEPTLVSCVVVPGFDFADFGLLSEGVAV